MRATVPQKAPKGAAKRRRKGEKVRDRDRQVKAGKPARPGPRRSRIRKWRDPAQTPGQNACLRTRVGGHSPCGLSPPGGNAAQHAETECPACGPGGRAAARPGTGTPQGMRRESRLRWGSREKAPDGAVPVKTADRNTEDRKSEDTEPSWPRQGKVPCIPQRRKPMQGGREVRRDGEGRRVAQGTGPRVKARGTRRQNNNRGFGRPAAAGTDGKGR